MSSQGASLTSARSDHDHGPLPNPEKSVTRRLYNGSGLNIDWGDVVVLGSGSNSQFITSTTLNYSAGWMGVALAPIGSNTRGPILLSGYTPVINVGSNTTTRGHFLYGSNMARRAYGSNTRTTGAFGQVLSTGVAPDAIIWPTTDGSGGGGSGFTNPMTTAGDLILGGAAGAAGRLGIGGSNTHLISDGVTASWVANTAGQAGSGARVYNTANISVSASTETALTFDSERSDSDAYHSTASNTSRITIPTGKAGRYAIGGTAEWAASALGTVRRLSLRLNGTTYLAKETITSIINAALPQSVATIYDLVAGDYVELVAFQDTVGAVNITAAGNYSPELAVALAPTVATVGGGGGTSFTGNPWLGSIEPASINSAAFDVAASNRAILTPFLCHKAVTVSTVYFRVATASGNIDFGIYAADAVTRLASTGSFACPAAGTRNQALTASVALEAGTMYWAAHAAGNTTYKLVGFVSTQSAIALGAQGYYVRGETSFALPSTLTITARDDIARQAAFWFE